MRDTHNTGANPYRMPAILTHDDENAWLPGDAREARAALRPYPSEPMIALGVMRAIDMLSGEQLPRIC
jgi:putative SOS response-associated peptidase YedK